MKKNNLKLTRTHYSKKVYGSRVSRNKFVVTELSAYIGIKILGVGGGGERRLANHLPKDAEYIEIDMARAPDVIINLEKDMPLPFKDNSFDTVVCTDVLEHIPTKDIFHFIDGLYSLSKKFIFLVVATQPASKLFEDGRNIHLTLKNSDEWNIIFEEFKNKYPKIQAVLRFNE